MGMSAHPKELMASLTALSRKFHLSLHDSHIFLLTSASKSCSNVCVWWNSNYLRNSSNKEVWKISLYFPFFQPLKYRKIYEKGIRVGVGRTSIKYLSVYQLSFICAYLYQSCHCSELAGTCSSENIQAYYIEREKVIEPR
jgi:hypothetical protein